METSGRLFTFMFTVLLSGPNLRDLEEENKEEKRELIGGDRGKVVSRERLKGKDERERERENSQAVG